MIEILGRLMLISIFPISIYFMWKKKIFSYNARFWITAILSFYIFINIINGNLYNGIINSTKSAEDCNIDIRAYEFGREMATISDFSNNISLEQAISQYSIGLGINKPYSHKNPCVVTGFRDAKKDEESIYNKMGKSWTSF